MLKLVYITGEKYRLGVGMLQRKMDVCEAPKCSTEMKRAWSLEFAFQLWF